MPSKPKHSPGFTPKLKPPTAGNLKHIFLGLFLVVEGTYNENYLHKVNVYYRPFPKTLPKYSGFVNWMSVRFYEMGCMQILNFMYRPLHKTLPMYSINKYDLDFGKVL